MIIIALLLMIFNNDSPLLSGVVAMQESHGPPTPSLHFFNALFTGLSLYLSPHERAARGSVFFLPLPVSLSFEALFSDLRSVSNSRSIKP